MSNTSSPVVVNVLVAGGDDMRGIVRLVEKRDPGPIKTDTSLDKYRRRVFNILKATGNVVALVNGKRVVMAANAPELTATVAEEVATEQQPQESAEDMVARLEQEAQPVAAEKPAKQPRAEKPAKVAAEQPAKIVKVHAIGEQPAKQPRQRSEGSSRGFADSAVINVVATVAPPKFRDGTGRAAMWSIVRDGMTFGQWSEAFSKLPGMEEPRRIGFLRFLAESGYITIK